MREVSEIMGLEAGELGSDSEVGSKACVAGLRSYTYKFIPSCVLISVV